MEYIVIVYLLLSMRIGETVQEQRNYQEAYVENQTIPDAHLVQDDPRFPQSYRDRNGGGLMTEESK